MAPSGQLPPSPSLQQLRNRAKDLLRALNEGDPVALQRLRQVHPQFKDSAQTQRDLANIKLADAQLVVAREQGFESWPKLKKHAESRSSSRVNMHELVAAGDLEAVKEAIARDPQAINQPNEAGLPPLYTAARCRHQSAVDLLINHGANVDIFACAYLGKAAEAKTLLTDNPEVVNATTSDGMTALHYAARSGRFEAAKVLVEGRADVNSRDLKGRTPLIEASHGGPWKQGACHEIIELLLGHGATTDLFTAAALGRVDVLQSILDKDPQAVNDPNEEGHTALYVAAQNNCLSAVKLLVEHEADVNRDDAVGIAALHRTSQQCDDELIQYLIEHGADAHLCCYAACGDEEGTRKALARNPQAIGEIFYEFNAVGYAVHCWNLGVLRILLQHGGVLSESDRQHILRISNNDQQLLDELLALQL